MSIRDASFLSNIQQENETSSFRSIPVLNTQGRVIDSLGIEDFKSVLSESKEKPKVVSKAQTASQSDSDKREVKKTEDDGEEFDYKKISSISPVILQEKLLQNSLIQTDLIVSSGETDLIFSSFDVIECSLKGEHSEFNSTFNLSDNISHQLILEDSMMGPAGFSESMAMQKMVVHENPEKMQSAGHESTSISEGETQIDLSPERAIVNMRADQRMDSAVLKNILPDQQLGASKIAVSTMTPMQTIPPLVTPILLSNFDSVNEGAFGTDSDLGIDAGSATSKPISFVESSQHQKQLLNKNGEGGAEDNPGKSFEGADSHAQQVSANAADSVQKTVAVQKLTQIIRDRAQDAIEKSQKDMTLNVKGIQTTLGEVELDLKITNKKISVRISSESKGMQTLLNQERSNIVSILNELIAGSAESEYVLADIPVEICHKERGI